MSILCGNCKNYHPTVAAVRDCCDPSLRAETVARRHDPVAMAESNMAALMNALTSGAPTPPPGDMVVPLPSISPAMGQVTEGIWRAGSVYKVQRAHHGSGRLYAKVLTKSDDGTWSFEYAPGAMKKLADYGVKMTLEEAKKFGTLYGVCCQCGRVLTDEKSIEAGIGPVCASKWSV